MDNWNLPIKSEPDERERLGKISNNLKNDTKMGSSWVIIKKLGYQKKSITKISNIYLICLYILSNYVKK